MFWAILTCISNLLFVLDSEDQTVGTMAIIDLDQDGYMELIASGYTADTVYIATFNVDQWVPYVIW